MFMRQAMLMSQIKSEDAKSKPKFSASKFHDCDRHAPIFNSGCRARISSGVVAANPPAETGGGVDGSACRLNISANSGTADNGFHSPLPTSWTRLCALARPSEIHW